MHMVILDSLLIPERMMSPVKLVQRIVSSPDAENESCRSFPGGTSTCTPVNKESSTHRSVDRGRECA